MACRSLPAAFNILQLSLCLGTEGGCISIVDLCVEIWTLELCRRGVLSELHGFRFGALKYFFFGSGVFAGMSMCCEGPNKSS